MSTRLKGIARMIKTITMTKIRLESPKITLTSIGKTRIVMMKIESTIPNKTAPKNTPVATLRALELLRRC